MTSWNWAADELAALEAKGLRRFPVTIQGPVGPTVAINGGCVLAFCSNDYLSLAADHRLRRASAEAALEWGSGSGASRLVSGTTEAHRRLEKELAVLKGSEDAILFSSGYLANTGTIPALAGPGDVIFSDELNHASIIDGCRLSKARLEVFGHRDYKHLEALLKSSPSRRGLIVTDTIFSMDGDLADLGTLKDLADRYEAMLMVDEAHATGVLGPTGGGAVEAAQLKGQIDLVMGTLSKALGSSGGFVAASKPMVDYLRNRARSYIFDTAPNPAAVGGALEALKVVRSEPERRHRVLRLAQRLASALESLGYSTGSPAAAIVPVIIGSTERALSVSEELLEQGIFIPAIRPPSVAPGAARLRATLMAGHLDDHIGKVIEAFANLGPHARRSSKPPNDKAPLPKNPLLQQKLQDGPGDIDRRILESGGMFITGTDTGVGKTVASAAIARSLRLSGLRIGWLKPVQTGAADEAPDSVFVIKSLDVFDHGAVSAYQFDEPLAPRVAAERAGAEIRVDRILTAFDDLKQSCDVVLVEGSGGLLVPLCEQASAGPETMAGLAGLLRLPLVIVARATLGTLNHTALTIEAARNRGLEVLGVIINRLPKDPGPAEASNPAEIMKLCRTNLIGLIPNLAPEGMDRLDPSIDPRTWFSPSLGGCLRPDNLTEHLVEATN